MPLSGHLKRLELVSRDLRALFIALLGAHLSGQLEDLFGIEVFGVAAAFRQSLEIVVAQESGGLFVVLHHGQSEMNQRMRRVDRICVVQNAFRAFPVFSESPGVLNLSHNKLRNGLRSAGPDGACSRRLGKPGKRFTQLAVREWSFWRYPGWTAVLRNFAEGDLLDTGGNLLWRIT